MKLKIAIIASGMTHQELAWRANEELDDVERLSELQITKLVTGRVTPSPRQQNTLARLLGHPVVQLFPEEGGVC